MKKTGSRVDSAELAALRAALHGLRDAPARDLGVARIAQRHRVEEVLEVLTSREPVLSGAVLRALAIELALRGKPIPPEHPELRRLARDSDGSEPPPWLLSIESQLPARIVRFGRSPEALSRPHCSEPRGWVMPEPLIVRGWDELTSELDRDAIAAPVRAWTEGSNGRFEARVFALHGARGAHPDVALLHALGLESVSSADDVQAAPTSAEAALAELFSAAHGGAYNAVATDSWARDTAWRSLRALIGAPARAPAVDVERDARAAGFTSISTTAESGGLLGGVWSIGLVAVSPARDRMAVLAASDED